MTLIEKLAGDPGDKRRWRQYKGRVERAEAGSGRS
jgi:hypothetical protein